LRLYGGLSLAIVVSMALLYGCGGSGSSAADETSTAAATTTANTTTANTQTSSASTAKTKILAYVKRRYGNEVWYPAIANVMMSGNSLIVSTRLPNHETSHRNKKQAEAICKAFATSPGVRYVSVFYDESGGGSTASCVSRRLA